MTQIIEHKDDDDQIKERHLKTLFELSKKSVGEIPQLDEPTNEQNQWIKRKMKVPSWAWRSFT